MGANAVVVKDVPPDSVVVGVPGRITRRHGERVVYVDHGQTHDVDLEHGALPDLTAGALRHLAERIGKLEKQMGVQPALHEETEEESWFYQI